MSYREENLEEKLGRHLDLHGAPSAEEMESARERLIHRLRFEPVAVEVSVAKPRRRWPAVAAIAAAITVAVLLPITRTQSAAAVLEEGNVSRTIQFGEVVRPNGGALVLEDGSRVEARADSELSFERVRDGVQIHLSEGSLIVNAAKQQDGRHLYVRMKDVMASLVGTVSLNAEAEGSRVTVIEGEARVQGEGAEKRLLSGEQLATSPSMPPRLVEESLAWSRNLSSLLARMEQSAMTIAMASAQAQEPMRPANTPKWEVVSIRPCGGDAQEPGARGGNGTPATGIMRPDAKLLRIACVPVRFLIERAYVSWIESDVIRRPWYFPITGGPSWIETDAYSLDAMAEGQPTQQEMRGPMLQVILEERFNLKIRREVREEPVYELRVADSGFKLQPLKEGECEAREAASDKAKAENAGKPLFTVSADGRLLPNATLAGPKGPMRCGYNHSGARDGSQPPPGAATQTLNGASMGELIRYLDLDRIILDKTGIQGQFDIELTYGRYNSPMREPRAPLPDGVVPGGDSVFDALRKQLGLTLVRARGPRIHYFVESITRPTPN
jgi:uncharacterized protein (TIGR03435 family)